MMLIINSLSALSCVKRIIFKASLISLKLQPQSNIIFWYSPCNLSLESYRYNQPLIFLIAAILCLYFFLDLETK